MDGALASGPGRIRLSHRRMHRSAAVEWNGVRVLIAAGFDRLGQVREIFLDGLRVGSDADVLMDDACILVSTLLQHGYSCAGLLAKLMRAAPEGAVARFRDEATGVAKPSFIAALLLEAHQLEIDHGAEIAALHRALAEGMARP